jgi:hypothetical protein
MRTDPLEKEIEKRVCLYAKLRGLLQYKFTSPNHRGVPDRMFVLPGGGVFFIEFKRKGEVPTALQEVAIAKLRKQGSLVFVVDSSELGKNTIDLVLAKGIQGLKNICLKQA